MKKICELCGGTGHISYFKGVSRFLLSTEDCPECAGLGFISSSGHDTTVGDKLIDRTNIEKEN